MEYTEKKGLYGKPVSVDVDVNVSVSVEKDGDYTDQHTSFSPRTGHCTSILSRLVYCASYFELSLITAWIVSAVRTAYIYTGGIIVLAATTL